MPSTEFLLYLVTVILVVVLIMNYMNQDNNTTKNKTEQDDKSQYVIELLKRQEHRDMLERERRLAMERNRDNRDNDTESEHSGSVKGCNNPQCARSGRCTCRQKLNINVNNVNDGPNGLMPPIDPLRKFDYDAVNDEFTPPFRRSYYEDYPLHPALLPTYTRGPPGRFRKVGTLIAQGVSHDDKYKFLNLIGREKYPGREYEYYVTSVDTESKIKFYIETKGKEIRDGDTVKVKNLDGYTFIFSEDEDLSPKYDPYFIY